MSGLERCGEVGVDGGAVDGDAEEGDGDGGEVGIEAAEEAEGGGGRHVVDAAAVVVELFEVAVEAEQASGLAGIEECVDEDDPAAVLEAALEAEEVGAALDDLDVRRESGVAGEEVGEGAADAIVAREGVSETDHEDGAFCAHASPPPSHATTGVSSSSSAVPANRAATGRRMVKVVPSATRLSTVMVPWCLLMMP